jgi:asparagine synthase (glutamine-hydrolysing)
MCGIAGYFGQGNKEILEKMTRSLRHRGPDDEGFFVDEFCGLGHRRLSIIDLSPAGRQPLANEDETVWLTYNGEIYNYRELRKSLGAGHRFRSETDTEVIVHLYEELGEQVFEKLQGMFALALYDKKNKKIILARDRLGKKPLYYGIESGTVFFGSELKALAHHPLFKRELDLASLNKYFLFDYIPAPHSIFKNVKKIEAASYLVYDGKSIISKKFWSIQFNGEIGSKIQNPKSKISQSGAVKELDTRLNDAVKSRLISDVPLGVFLSGGIDSSTIAYYAQKNSSQNIKTFSIGFKEKSFDESSYARLAAAHLGTDHHEEMLGAGDSLALVPHLAQVLDEPMADASILPTLLLSKFARERVTVALGGDGGDELFCGYDTFLAHRLGLYYEKLPKSVRRLFAGLACKLPVSSANLSLDFKLKRFVSGFDCPRDYRDAVWMSSFGKVERSRLFNQDTWKTHEVSNEYEDIDRHLGQAGDIGYFDRLIYSYLKLYLPESILVKVDRASMHHSLEVRAPFLDTAVVDFANSLPLTYKLKNFKQKYILKQLMAGRLPTEIINRKKKGFGVPLADWFNHELKTLTENYLSKEKIEQEGLFDHDYIAQILKEHHARRKDNRKQIWSLLVFELWREKWGDNR